MPSVWPMSLQRADVRMRESRDGACLTLKAFANVGALRKVGGEDFDGDRTAQSRVVGAIDLAHSPFPNLRFYLRSGRASYRPCVVAPRSLVCWIQLAQQANGLGREVSTGWGLLQTWWGALDLLARFDVANLGRLGLASVDRVCQENDAAVGKRTR